jgi:SAM-dependent methyltransferase
VSYDALLSDVERYYSGKFAEHGATARGVDWNSEASQDLRFTQLMRIVEDDEPFSINDYGCGYGALAAWLDEHRPAARYVGFDVSESMVVHARATHPDARFVTADRDLEPADYTVASGIFNVRLGADDAVWQDYILHVIDRLAALSRRGFAFNMLTSYSDPEKMRSDLFYGDPCFFFDRCKRKYAQKVALLHDYGLWEFTVLVRV